MTITRCRSCLAWDPYRDSSRDVGDDEARGICRRFAPRPTFSGQLNEEQGSIWAEFPVTMNRDGCCEGLPNVWAES